MELNKKKQKLMDKNGAIKECIVFYLELGNKVLVPDDLPELSEKMSQQLDVKEGDFQSPIFLSGRAPIWAHTALIQVLRPGSISGTFDPKWGFVVASSLYPQYQVGDIFHYV